MWWTAVLVAALPLAGTAQSSSPTASQLWDDYTHYIQVARPQLAAEAAAGVIEADAGELLDAVEASRFADPTRVFERAAGMSDIAEISVQIQDKIQQARLERSREPARIAADIDRLTRGQRAFENATERLAAAGQFAAPQLLAALLDKDRADQHPAILRAITIIGRPLVAPLSIALPRLDPVAQGQVARALAEIGYPQAVPALKRVAEDPATDPTAREIVIAAIGVIADDTRVNTSTSAAELYLALGEGAYRVATTEPLALDTFDRDTGSGVVWRYDPRLTVTGEPGLVPVVVPGPIAGDAVALQAARTALSLDPDLDQALSLFLMANLRRENRLSGQADPSYPGNLPEPGYYARVAGPDRLHDVLGRALDDLDPDLALDAIAALADTASLDALRPLVRGLGYPDRRVRFRSAEALAYAMPAESFENDFRVVPVLGDAVRQGDLPLALIVTPDRDDRNALNAAVANLGYRTLETPSVDQAAGLVANTPGVDLIVVQGNRATVVQADNDAASNFKLAATPIVAFVDAASQPALSARFADQPRVSVVVAEGQNVEPAVRQAAERFGGTALTSDEATGFALRALELLKEIAVTDTAYDVGDALPALIAAVQDPRPAVAVGAGDVLARLDNPDAQAAVASAAINGTGDTQVAHLADLADSANRHGNLIPALMSDDILALVKSSGAAGDDDLALAAAQAHGALNLPTRNAVDLILGE
ncbi:MAG: hypothetical protein AAFX76_10535 [Planctomycetota bacterium]